MVIGVTGGSGSGKTTVIKKLMEVIPPNRVATLHMDSYYKDSSHLPLEERARLNFDHPDAIDFDLLFEHLQLLIRGQPVQQPTYDYTTSSRKKETSETKPAPVLILEGILVFSDKRILELLEIKIFVDADADERLLRIIERDIKERGQTLQSILERYVVVKQMHEQFVEPAKRLANIIIPMDADNQVAIQVLADIIARKV